MCASACAMCSQCLLRSEQATPAHFSLNPPPPKRFNILYPSAGVGVGWFDLRHGQPLAHQVALYADPLGVSTKHGPHGQRVTASKGLCSIAIQWPPPIEMELPDIACADLDVHVWSALLTCLRPRPPEAVCLSGCTWSPV